MATVITEECINCGACLPRCPNNAIYEGGQFSEFEGAKRPPLAEDIYYIAPDRCTECVGFFDHEECVAACPVDCCVPDPNIPESEHILIYRARRLHSEPRSGRNFLRDSESRAPDDQLGSGRSVTSIPAISSGRKGDYGVGILLRNRIIADQAV